MSDCRGCGSNAVVRVLDVGKVPAADHFPLSTDPVGDDTLHDLAMDLCTVCGLAQLADDDTVTDEPRGVEPQALVDQAAAAIELVGRAGWLRGSTVREFGSPHGGTWVPLLTARGFAETISERPADVVLDCFGIMHEPDQRAAFRTRAAATAEEGVLLLQFHSLETIVEQHQWNALRHGHFGYYSLTTLQRLLGDAGMSAVAAWEFDLYGGTVLIAAVHGHREPEPSVVTILDRERDKAIADPTTVGTLQIAADRHVGRLRAFLESERKAGRRTYAYGAASRAVALFAIAGLDSAVLAGIADASPAKQGRRMPATDIPIITPAALVSADPDRVVLMLPDLLTEVSAQFPDLAGRWVVDLA
ncbi:transferase [Antrihabitans stalactiti]|uniref:Transferase n=1 Tax=Antrihabitans stalactiti TaxID=2584121 RepID=A0A848KJ23_9NOCA|nr:transferase [Antrihabitans stalactiti]NMN96672.1 transferase [Antrihabitans stalactiti]